LYPNPRWPPFDGKTRENMRKSKKKLEKMVNIDLFGVHFRVNLLGGLGRANKS